MIINMAHRGFSGKFPENTLLAFEKAIEIGADYIELDVHKSKDGELVVAHDREIKVGRKRFGLIAEMNYADIRTVSLPKHQYIPNLEEVLIFIKRTPIKLNIELKVPNIEPQVVLLTEKYDMYTQVMFSSFNFKIMEKIRSISPKATIGIINGNFTEDKFNLLIQQAQAIKAEFLNLRFSSLTQEYVDRIHAARLKVNVWTIDMPLIMKKFIKKGVDVITTNRPDKLKKLLQNSK